MFHVLANINTLYKWQTLHLVYKIDCKDCSESFIEQTKYALK